MSSLVVAAANGQGQGKEDEELAPNMAAPSTSEERKLAVNFAAKGGDKEALGRLLKAGCDADMMDSNGWTPLMHAAFSGHTECLKLLIQHGADVSIRTETGTAAHFAASRGHKQELLTLLEAGCGVDVADKCGRTPLMCAAVKGHSACLEPLIERGADVRICLVGGKTAAQYAAQSGRLEALRVLFAFGGVEVVPPDACLSIVECAASASHVDVLACGCYWHRPPFVVGKAVRAFCSALCYVL